MSSEWKDEDPLTSGHDAHPGFPKGLLTPLHRLFASGDREPLSQAGPDKCTAPERCLQASHRPETGPSALRLIWPKIQGRVTVLEKIVPSKNAGHFMTFSHEDAWGANDAGRRKPAPPQQLESLGVAIMLIWLQSS